MLSEAEIVKYVNLAREKPNYYATLVERQCASFINET